VPKNKKNIGFLENAIVFAENGSKSPRKSDHNIDPRPLHLQTAAPLTGTHLNMKE
jgi:hypothetical protein